MRSEKINFLYSAAILFALFCFHTGKAQITYSGKADLQAFYSDKENLPFWVYSGKRGRISEETNFSALLSSKLNYGISEKSELEIGGGIVYLDGVKDEIYIDELYANFNYSWLQVTAGRKQKDQFYNGLSATNENILWSLNAKSIPGIQFKTNKPIYLDSNRKFGFEASWNEYYMGDNPGAENVRLHHKKIQFLYDFGNGWDLRAGLQHFVQWGGASEAFGEQPDGFSDYLKIISGRAGGDNSLESDQANALGNHLGSWELYLSKKYSDFSVRFIYNNLFEDGSGSRLANMPDGRYGIFLSTEEDNQLINSFIYEFFHVRDKNEAGPHLYDNYFNNGVYPFGWTYKERIIGVPFFTYDSDLNYIVNNKFIAHHIGFRGQIPTFNQALPYKILLSYAQNQGNSAGSMNRDHANEEVLKLYSKWTLLDVPVIINFICGSDFSSLEAPNYGIGLSLSKQF